MATMNVSLPDALKTWAESRTEDGRYANVSDYVRDLIRRDREHSQQLETFRAEVKKGRDSGISSRTMDDIWQDVKARQATDA